MPSFPPRSPPPAGECRGEPAPRRAPARTEAAVRGVLPEGGIHSRSRMTWARAQAGREGGMEGGRTALKANAVVLVSNTQVSNSRVFLTLPQALIPKTTLAFSSHLFF